MNPDDLLSRPLQEVRGIGPSRGRLLGRLGISTINDALFRLPFRYEDRTCLKLLADLCEGEFSSVRGRVIQTRTKRPKGRVICEATINDGSGLLRVRWFNQPYLNRSIRVGREMILTGRVQRGEYGWRGLEIENPEYEIVDSGTDDSLQAGRIVPIYRLTEGISQKQIRRVMFNVVSGVGEALEETLPQELMDRLCLPGRRESVRSLHFPPSDADVDLLNRFATPWHRRLIFEELLIFQIGVRLTRMGHGMRRGIAFLTDGRLEDRLRRLLPFRLTGAQERVLAEIRSDMVAPVPMHRLVQGDVGCGKTVLALFAMLRAVECGYQAALMAPTDILAVQHFLGIRSFTEQLGVPIDLLTGATGRRPGSVDPAARIIVGTHSLIRERAVFDHLGLVVIDEQHKFGVVQRSALAKKGDDPDVLIMTATPIPRSLALTLYGDLDCSVVDELPSGRKPVTTKVFFSRQKEEIYRILRREISMGRQAFAVYPVIEESEDAELRSAVAGRDGFARVFPEFRIGLLHGRMTADERNELMTRFQRGEIDLLVSTTVIEVGVDVPNATVMVIVHAERFGLAQLHQLRGRVGRGAAESFCLLIAYPPLGDDAEQRLQAMVATSDGFRIAEEDLAIRGPGDFLGTRQSGIPEFRIADLRRDHELLDAAVREASCLVAADPGLERTPSLRRAVQVFWKGKTDLAAAG